ncbi:MAG: hypothetical protein Rubg2KO_38230 [Rubricoccaceae bacterium]
MERLEGVERIPAILSVPSTPSPLNACMRALPFEFAIAFELALRIQNTPRFRWFSPFEDGPILGLGR